MSESYRVRPRRFIPSLLAGLSLVGHLGAQEPEGAAESEPERQVDDVVIVTGQRTYQSLVNEAAVETESFYMRLNEVLDEDDFRIDCDNERPPGSNIVRRVCRTRFQEEILSRAAVQEFQGIQTNEAGELIYNGAFVEIQPDLVRKMQEFEEAVVQAVNADPELNASVVRLMRLKAAVENYETPREQRLRLEREAAAEE